ncbi:MAG: dTDP-4-dehydrorhamnose reductase [Patescibacteria group bacterium]
MKQKVLVTGAKGQLGKKIIEMLGNDYELVLTDSEEMDITDKEKVFEVISEVKPDFIIHGAAYTRVDDAEEKIDLCRKINAEGSKNVALAAEANHTTLLYISTDFVFDGKKKAPYTEEDETNPESIYAKTKLEGENYVREYCSKYYIFRTAWLFGELPEGHPGTNFVEAMLKLASERDSLNVVSDQIGSPTYTGDLVAAMKKIIESDNRAPYGIYHVSGIGEASWFDFAKEIFKQTDTQIDLKPIFSDQYPQKAKRPSYSYLDKSKIEKALDIKIRPWQEMLHDYLHNRLKNE